MAFQPSSPSPRAATDPLEDTASGDTGSGDIGRRFSTATVLFHSAIAARMGLNVTDWKCGEIIARLGAMNPGKLSELTGLSSAATTLVLDRLEALRFVRRERDPNDRRKVIVQPVPNPTRDAEIQGLFAPMNARVAALMTRYTPEQLEGIADFMTRAAAAIEEEALALRRTQ
jgi:DNA-binding MarR family transcriptional regulator